MVAAVWAGQQGSGRRGRLLSALADLQVAGEAGLAGRGEEEGPRTAVGSTQEIGPAWL